MKRIFLFAYLMIDVAISNAQYRNPTIELKDTAYISIQKVEIDSFPLIKLRFTAETQKGFAFWNVSPDKIKVTENGTQFEAISLKSLTKELPLQVGIVLDQSGSMISDDPDRLTYYDLLFRGEELRRNSPLEKAKRAIGQFLDSYHNQKDSLTLITFATTVNLVSTHTNNSKELKGLLNKVDLEDGTSFYDALTVALDSISRHKGLRTLIALTDGADTHSITTLRSVVEKSKKLDIPIFVIGLGKVDHVTLSEIAAETSGEYLYTSKASSLPALYEKIAGKLKAVYELRYQSENFSSQDTIRAISLAVADSTISVKSVEKSFVLTSKIKNELIQRERNRSYTYYSMAGAGIISLIFFGLYKRKKKKEEIA